MEFEKPHRSCNSNTSSSELFICFTSRPSFSSSASMKLSSKPICSPGRSDNKFREHPTLSFSSSLNRRHGGSMKAGQSSPMFKKKGCGGFENAEPSSPKVTCIGQVRVKTKKQGKKMMSGILQDNKKQGQRNQKWVHLPLTICEALRGFGAEFNCFLPCGRSCSSRGRGEKRRSMSSCGAAFAKWMMALQEGEEEKGRDIRVIVGEEDKSNEKEGVVEYQEERLSICIPPRNALLLMRCRSEPLRMAALANRFWESPIQDEDSEDEENEEHGRDDVSSVGNDNEDEEEYTPAEVVEELIKEELVSAESVEELEQEHSLISTDEQEDNFLQEQLVSVSVSDEVIEEQEDNSSNEEWGLAELFKEDENFIEEEIPPRDQCSVAENFRVQECEVQEHSEKVVAPVKEEWDLSEVVDVQEVMQQCDAHKEETTLQQEEEQKHVDKAGDREEQQQSEAKVEEKESKTTVLPDCLLMMLCEPKLSMEVSKETWVCSTDFIQRRSQKQGVHLNAGDDDSKAKHKHIKKSDPCQQQKEQSFAAPPCPGPSMASMIEQKLMKAVAYEPFVLTRCKSEPLRSSAKLVPEGCFWNNPHVEPPPRVGF